MSENKKAKTASEDGWNDANVLNLCPHPITIVGSDGKTVLLKAQPFLGMGKGLRAHEEPLVPDKRCVGWGVPVFEPPVYDGVEGKIPPEVKGKIVIVSMLAAPSWEEIMKAGATSVVGPYTGTDPKYGALRDDKGQLTMSRAIVRWDK